MARLKEKIDSRWVNVSILVILAVAGITCEVQKRVSVEPRDFKIKELESKIGELNSKRVESEAIIARKNSKITRLESKIRELRAELNGDNPTKK